MPDKNKSEILLEAYLRSNGYSDFDFEPELPGTTKRPDYQLRWAGGAVLLEVKEFRGTLDDFKPGVGSFDPYGPLREKIGQARKKFRELEQHCCCLVLHNVDKPLILLDWQHVFGAMLGNLGWSFPIDLAGHRALDDTAIESTFTSGGKMHRERAGQLFAPQNQTVSAILVVGRVAAGERLFNEQLRQREAKEARAIGLEERLNEAELAAWSPADLRRRPLRVVVHDNPYARIPLPNELFRGPWDERYGDVDGRIQCRFRGVEIAKLP